MNVTCVQWSSLQSCCYDKVLLLLELLELLELLVLLVILLFNQLQLSHHRDITIQ